MKNPCREIDPELLEEACPECGGAGWIPKLYPSGHTEAGCENCDGTGSVPTEYEPARPKVQHCTCGADKCKLPIHSSWCDKVAA